MRAVALALLTIAAGVPPLVVPADPTLVLLGGTIYPAPDAAPIEHGVVVVEGSRIAAVGDRASVKVPAGGVTIDCSGLYVTAGFQNSHAHFTEAKWIDAADQPASKIASQIDAMFTRYGFTTVVDTGSALDDTGAIRRRIESEEIAGPRILTAGAPLFPKDGIPY